MATVAKTRSPFGDLLRELLDEHCITIRELARRLATTDDFTDVESKRRMLQRYIAGAVIPNERVRHEIADAFPVERERLAVDREQERELRRVHDALLPLADVLCELAKIARDRSEQ